MRPQPIIAGTKKVAGIHAPGAAGSPERMTLTIPGILSSRRIVLLFMGQDKLNVYNEAKAGQGSSPIRDLLAQKKVPSTPSGRRKARTRASSGVTGAPSPFTLTP